MDIKAVIAGYLFDEDITVLAQLPSQARARAFDGHALETILLQIKAREDSLFRSLDVNRELIHLPGRALLPQQAIQGRRPHGHDIPAITRPVVRVRRHNTSECAFRGKLD